MRKLYPFLVIALASLQTASAISQYELENKPTQFQVAYNSPVETVYIDLSTINLVQAGPTYNTYTLALLVCISNKTLLQTI